MERVESLKRKAMLYSICITALIALFYIIFIKYEKNTNDSPSQLNSFLKEINEDLKLTSQSIKTGKEILSNKK